MKATNSVVGSGLRQKLANAKGRFSTQFMSGDLQTENLSKKKAVEESVKMGGYELGFEKKKPARIEPRQPMTGHSEFWIG